MKAFAVTASALVIVAAAVLFQSVPTMKSPSTSANQLWAEGVLYSLQFSEMPDAQVEQRFHQAIELASQKAPIYVAMAEAGYGPKRRKASFDNAVEQTINGSSTDDILDELISSFKSQPSAKTQAYLAAVAHDPTCRLAWLQLTDADDELISQRAIAELRKLDPDNALPCYIDAAQAAEAGHKYHSLELIIEGNSKPACRTYTRELPKRAQLRFPNTSAFRELDVVGQPLSDQALPYLLDLQDQQWSWTESLPRRLRTLGLGLIEGMEHQVGCGESNEAERQLVAARDMGLKLINEETRSMMLMMTGFTLAKFGHAPLLEHYKEFKDELKIRQLDAMTDRLRRFSEAFRPALETTQTTTNLRRNLLGREDYLATRRLLLNAAAEATR